MLKYLINNDITRYLNTYNQVRKITKLLNLEESCDVESNVLEEYLDYSVDIYKYIGNGSNRIVFDIGDFVLKIALHELGRSDNLSEHNIYKELQDKNKLLAGRLAEILYMSKGGRCLIMEKLSKNINALNEDIYSFADNFENITGCFIDDLSCNNIMLDLNNQWKLVDYAMIYKTNNK